MVSIVLITGGSRGIGAATARLAASLGHDVVINFVRDIEAAADVVRSCRTDGAKAMSIRADVTDEAAVREMFDSVEHEFGAVGILVNNAGILQQQMRFDAMSLDRWRQVMNVNIIGAFLCAREAVRRMSTAHGGVGGSIVNVSSAASRLGSPGEYVDYAASKGAIDSMTIGLAKEVAAEGIRVNCVRPGVIRTGIHSSGGEPQRVERLGPMVPMKRGGEPEEVAEAIMWLASRQASYCTGVLLDCAGGL